MRTKTAGPKAKSLKTICISSMSLSARYAETSHLIAEMEAKTGEVV